MTGRITVNTSLKLKIRPMAIMAVLPGLYYLANLVRMLTISSIPYYVILAISGTIGLCYMLFQKQYNMNAVVLYFAVYVITLGLNFLLIRNYRLETIGNDVLLFGVAVILLLHRQSLRFSAFVFYVTAAVIVYSLSVSNTRHIFTSSSNYISVVILLAAALYYMALESDRGELRLIDILPAGICFYLSVWAEGRGGILASTALLVFMLILYFLTLSNRRAKTAVILVIIGLLALVFLYMKNISLVESFLGLGKWKQRGLNNSARSYIWGQYYKAICETPLYYLFGGPVNRIAATAYYSGNTHNSFIQLHAYNGLLMLLIVLVLCVRAAICYIRKKQYISLIMMGVVILRGLSDKFIFGQYGMPIMLFYLLMPYVVKRKRGRQQAMAVQAAPESASPAG